jgi:hypothetical protein
MENQRYPNGFGDVYVQFESITDLALMDDRNAISSDEEEK